MSAIDRIKPLVISALTVAIVFAVISANAVSGQADPFTEIREKLSGISEEEKLILTHLFTLAQEIKLMEEEEKKLAQEMEKIKKEIKGLEAAIADKETAYENKRESLKRVLKSYQRMGPGSFLEILLDSDSLNEFLQRINILRELSHSTEELLKQLDASRKMLAEEKAELGEKLALIEVRQKQAGEALSAKMKLKDEKEKYLISLKGKMEYYQEHLAGIEQVWNELKTIFSDTANEFSRIIEEGSLTADAMRLSFSFFEIRAAIDDKIINKIVSEQSRLPEMVFTFHPGKVEISLPEKGLLLSGTFIVVEGRSLKFQAQEGSFMGMPLSAGSIEELFTEGGLELDLKPLLAGNEIDALEIKEGYLELISKLNLF